jgi:hypothetical protein
MTKRKPNPTWRPLAPKGKPAGPLGRAVAAVGVLKADAAYAKAVRSGDRKAVKAAASKMRTAQRRAGHVADPAKLASVADAVKARAAYDRAVASGDPRAVKAASTKLARFQRAAAGDQDRDRRGRFT